MRKKLEKLVDVKSIVTIMLTLVFCLMTAAGKISSDQFMTIFATVTAFYFGTQHQKNCEHEEEPSDNDNNEE